MVIAKIYVDGVSAKVTDLQKIPKGIAGAVIEVTYAANWEGLTKTAVFAGAVTRDVLNADGAVVIPAEVVDRSGYRLKVGFYGTSNVIIPTLWADLGTVQDAADPSGDPGTDPELPVWAQLQKEFEELKEAGGIKGEKGDPGPQGPAGPQGERGTQGPQGIPGNDYVITPDDYAEIAEMAAGLVEVPEGGNKDFSELFRLKTTEEVKRIETGINLNEYSEIFALCNAVSSDGKTTSHFAWLVTGFEWLINNQLHATQKRLFMLHGKKIAGKKWFFETGFGIYQGGDITNPTISSPAAASTMAVADKWTYSAYTFDHITDNFGMGAYSYADVNLDAGAEVIVFGRK